MTFDIHLEKEGDWIRSPEVTKGHKSDKELFDKDHPTKYNVLKKPIKVVRVKHAQIRLHSNGFILPGNKAYPETEAAAKVE